MKPLTTIDPREKKKEGGEETRMVQIIGRQARSKASCRLFLGEDRLPPEISRPLGGPKRDKEKETKQRLKREQKNHISQGFGKMASRFPRGASRYGEELTREKALGKGKRGPLNTDVWPRVASPRVVAFEPN